MLKDILKIQVSDSFSQLTNKLINLYSLNMRNCSFGLCPLSILKNNKTTAFRSWILLPSSGKKREERTENLSVGAPD
jgi:hypothetical protein